MTTDDSEGFRLPPRSAKPRTRGMTSIIDYGPDTLGWTGERGIADLLSCCAAYIDFAKIYATNALLIPRDTMARIVALYRDADVVCYSGGILFEYAYLRNEVDACLTHLRALGFTSMEISENYVTLDVKERRAMIDKCQKRGLSVIYEFGRKNPTEPFGLEHLGESVEDALRQGVRHVILEQSELTFAGRHDANLARSLRMQPWFQHVLIEVDPFRFPEQHIVALRDFGVDASLANVAPGQALRLEGFRRGVGRAVDYPLVAQPSQERRGSE